MTRRHSRSLRRLTRAAATAGGALLASLALAGPAAAADEWGFEPGTYGVSAYELVPDGGGERAVEITQAGAHPQYLSVGFMLRRRRHPQTGELMPNASLRSLTATLPAGLSGDPQATPRCSMAQFQNTRCSALSMVGISENVISGGPGGPSMPVQSAVYNVTPPEGMVAQFAFKILTVTITLSMRIRDDGRYDLATDLSDLSQGLAVHGSRLMLFGVPADLQGPGRYFSMDGPWGGSSGAPRRALLTLGASCGVQAPATISATSWSQPTEHAGDSFTMPALTGCEAQQFGGRLDAAPDRPRAGAPAGFGFDLSIPQATNASALGTPPLRRAEVTLPEGVAVSPSSVTGLQGCTDAQAALASEADPDCPDAARIGSVQIDTPVLSEPLSGGIFLGQPKSMDAQTGEMLRVFLLAEGQGVTIKQEGRIVPNPVTGRLTATFDQTPQLPFSKLSLRFNGGERAPLSNPQSCGTHTTSTRLTSWGGQTSSSTSSFAITEGPLGTPCGPLGFAPSFEAGMANAAAGQSSAFTLAFGRDDAQQDLGALDVTLPAGVMGMVSQAELCDEARANAGTCGEDSRIGGVRVSSGPGANPFPLAGKGVYLTGPYKGGAFGMSIVVPALAGPFDLGTVVVRAAIHVDRKTAALRVVSDPMPTILQGIPLRMRQVVVSIDKPGFMVNPTSCSEKRVGATVSSATGATASVGSRFQAAGCRALPFRPKLALRIGARGRTRNGVTTPFQAKLTMPSGNANNRVVTVKLPRTINSRLKVINEASCALAEFEAEKCDKPVGSAIAHSPVLRAPVRGQLFFVRNPERRIPDLAVRLKGEGREAGVVIDLTGKVTIPRDLTLRTDFDTIPDVPISGFQLDLVAGRRGAIGLIGNACLARTRRQAIADVSFRAQSGVLKQARQRLAVAGCGRASSAKKTTKRK